MKKELVTVCAASLGKTPGDCGLPTAIAKIFRTGNPSFLGKRPNPDLLPITRRKLEALSY